MDDNVSNPNVPQPSGIKSLLHNLGLGGKKGNEDVPPPEETSSDLASRLNGIDNQSPSLDGADVVRGPNLTGTEDTTQLSQEPQVQASDLGASGSAASIGEPTIESPAPTTPEPPLPVGTSPDLTDSVINPLAQDASQSAGGAIQEQAVLANTRENLVEIKNKVQEALKEIDEAMGTKLADSAADTPVVSTEPVGTTF